MRNLDEIRAAYERGDGSLRELAEGFGIPERTLFRRASDEKWQQPAAKSGSAARENGSASPQNGSRDHVPTAARSGSGDSQNGTNEAVGGLENGSTPAPLFCLLNLSSAQVERLEPWAYCNGAMPHGMSKEEYRGWCADPKTEHLFYSGFEGANSALRVSESNPAMFMHGLVVDYDARVAPEERHAFMGRSGAAYPPNYISATFSGGVRLVWLFEGPVPLFTRRITEAFLSRIRKELKLKKMFPALDDEALMRPGQYYHCGHDWEPLSPKPLSLDLLHSWAMAASQKADWSGFGDEIPIDRVAEEVERRFPGSWPGLFEIGARGNRFWDPTASNPTATIVRSTGMQCFTGPRPFVSWGEILGRKFVDEFRADSVGAAIRGIWFDGRDYWLNVDEVWRLFRKSDISLHLRVERGISDERRKGVVATPMDQVLHQVHQAKCVDGAAPFVFRNATVINFAGKRYLNIARSRLIRFADGPQPWGENFPYIADLLDGYFDPPEQLPFFLSWLAYGYQQAAKGEPRNGQAVFLAGDVNQGKTLVSNVLIGDLLGGHMDASDYLLGESKYNKELFEVGLWTVDDTVPSSDPRKQQLYSAMLKKIPANYSFQYHPKFRDQFMLPWAGRVIITCNADPESIRILPDVEMSLLDKVMLFKIATVARDFTDAAARIRAELPFFARFLHDYEIPEPCLGDARFRVKCYHHEELIETAQQSSKTAAFIELLEIFKRSFFSNGAAQEWTGSATQLLSDMLADEATKNIASKYTPDQIGRRLSQLKAQDYPLDYLRDKNAGRTRTWVIKKTEDRCENNPF